MRPIAKTGFLVGYNSRNIYRILLLDEEMVIGTRDVIFDETLFSHNLTKPTPKEETIPIIDFEMIPTIPDYLLDITDPPDDSLLNDNNDKYLNPSQIITNQRPNPVNSGDINEANIIIGSRTRKNAREANSLNPGAFVTDFNIFTIGRSKSDERLHQSVLPPPPENWRELNNHPYMRAFRDAMELEYRTLESKKTFKQVKQTDLVHPIPLKWVFKYKFDDAGYLLKFKARICVRGDLQPRTDEDNHAATLAYQVFRLLMALVALFDLETIQADAVNAFCNSPLGDEVYVYNPPGFKRNRHVLQLLRGLYGLRKSPKLWLRLLSGTLQEIGLHQVPGQPCVHTDCIGILVFLFVDDLVFMFPTIRRSDTLALLNKLTQKFEF